MAIPIPTEKCHGSMAISSVFINVQGLRSSRSSRSSISGPGPLPQEPANDARSLDVGPWLAEEWQTLGGWRPWL